MTIPKIIWQTYKEPYSRLPYYAKEASQSWVSMNPEYKYYYMDDTKAAEFVLREYGEEWHKIFIECPVGVMRGDLWRYLVIYRYGGIYADLDTICQAPVDVWVNPDYDMLVCPETESHFCQWTFAASKNHPIIKEVLNVIKEGFKNPDYNNEHFVHSLTGPAVWTKGIKTGLNILNEPHRDIIEDYQYYNNLDAAKQHKFYCYGGENYRLLHWQAVRHIYGSQNWNDGQYVRWIAERVHKVPQNNYELQ